MRQLKELVTTDSRFQKSVNLHLDLDRPDRLESYIPTRSSAAILRKCLKTVGRQNRESAIILIGPYGKGKSHLLLVLSAILRGRRQELSHIAEKIQDIDLRAGELIEEIWSRKKPYLTVLISAGRNDLNQSFLFALKEALEWDGISGLAPESDYTEAGRIIARWEQEFPAVYRKLEEMLNKGDSSLEDLREGLARQDRRALHTFIQCYPKLTAGSQFIPMMQMEAFRAYREVNRELAERRGYAGILVIFDEFSKYIEGHETEGFSRDMKTLQDMCELANHSEEPKLCMVLVAHKSIHEYEKGIEPAVKNAFLGVEGRLKEIPFVVSAQNNYELIADSIQKTEPEFSEEYGKRMRQEHFRSRAKLSHALPCFRYLFASYEEYERVMEKGCFPLTPVCAYALLHISEKVAQNERTIFTFLTSRERGSLPRILEKSQEHCVGVDAVYDYFKGLFRENNDQPKIHNEWLKAEFALKKVHSRSEQRIVKAVAILLMIGQEEELPAKEEPICNALGMETEEYRAAMERLQKQGIIIFRTSLGVYAFRNNIGVDIEKEITRELSRQSSRFPLCEYLRDMSALEYILPKQHNQKRSMTRYFQYEYLTVEQFLALEQSEYVFREMFADGKILALISENKIEPEQIRRKTEKLNEERIVVLVPDQAFGQSKNIRRLAAIRALRAKKEFMEANQVLEQELSLYEEDIIFEVNCAIEKDFLPGEGNCMVCHTGKVWRRFDTEMQFNRYLSGLCESYYRFSPKVNHELLNIQHVAGQYLRARNHVVDALIAGQAEQYAVGTAPECMVYRATFVRTGMTGEEFGQDQGCVNIVGEMDRFFADCVGRRQKFSQLYLRLQGKDYGVRKGILPLFLAQKLSASEAVPVIYLRKKELEVCAETLNRVNDFPEDYELYLEEKSAGKEQYVKELERMFGMNQRSVSRQKRWELVVQSMQKWYRSLPQYAMVTKEIGTEEEASRITSFRNLLKRAELNPREALFEKLPRLSGQNAPKETSECIREMKEALETVFPRLVGRAADAVRSIFGAEAKDSLKACLLSWYQRQRRDTAGIILSSGTDNLLKYLEGLETNDETEIIRYISKLVLDLFMEDWKDETLPLFEEELKRIRQETETASANGQKMEGKSMIILQDGNGRHFKRQYSADIGDSTCSYLKNMIDEALEDFGESLETNQKVAVLAKVIEELM